MIDTLAFIIGSFLICFLTFIIWLGIKLFSNLANAGQYSSCNKETDRQEIENSVEDSQGDGLMGIDEGDDYSDILFPEEEE
jgi:hypothetical protein